MRPVIHRGPRGTVYSCPHCKLTELVLRGGPGSGRGHGLRTGGAAYSRMAAHIRNHLKEKSSASL